MKSRVTELPEQHDCDPLVTLQAGLAALQASGADRFKPIAFQYVLSLGRRAQAEGAAKNIAARAIAALRDYEAQLSKARAEAEALIAQLLAAQPDCAQELKPLLQKQDFRAVRAAARKLQQACARPSVAALTRVLNSIEPATDTAAAPPTLGTAMREQELQVIGALQGETTGCGTGAELRSLQALQESLAVHSARQLLTQEMRGAAPDSGPLNPHMLAIKSLAIMGDISPAYLGRFVAYVDALFWLEQASAGYSAPQP